MSDAPKAGEIWDYPYLWAWQDARGETEGRKSRPSAVAVALRKRDGHTCIYLLAVTTQPPAKARAALEIPDTEKHRAGLSGERRQWVILDEFNRDIFEKSYYLEPGALTGRFSLRFLRQIQSEFRNVVAAGAAMGIDRHDD